MISWLGYEKRKFIFWCPPGKAIDELTEVVFQRDCKLMAEASVDSKVLVWFIHHPSEEEQQVKDEISRGENSEDSDQDENYQYSSDEDPAWHDSDYDMKEDDDLFEEHVDDSEIDEMVDKGKKNTEENADVPGPDDVDEVDLELPMEDDSERRHKSDSDDEEYKKKKKKKQVPYKFKPFNLARAGVQLVEDDKILEWWRRRERPRRRTSYATVLLQSSHQFLRRHAHAAVEVDEEGAAVVLCLPLRHALRACGHDAAVLRSQLRLPATERLLQPVLAVADTGPWHRHRNAASSHATIACPAAGHAARCWSRHPLPSLLQSRRPLPSLLRSRRPLPSLLQSRRRSARRWSRRRSCRQ
jgi:hypothetical protein